jgi:putative transposase
MKRDITPAAAVASGVDEAWRDIGASFERFCLTAGIRALADMMERDAADLCGPRYGREDGRRGHRWGQAAGKLGFHGGKLAIERPRVRARDGHELALPSWEAAQAEDWLGPWTMNLMLINVSTRRFGRAVRLPEGDVPAHHGAGVSKSAASRRFVALSAARMKEWMAADLAQLDLLVIQIDGIYITEDLTLLAAIGIDAEGGKHPLGLLEGATENAAVVQALLDNLIERGLDPRVCRLFIIDGSKALAKAIRKTFGRHTPIQRCQIHKARNILERLPKHLHATVRTVLRQAWELDDAAKAERLIRNLARRLEQAAPGVSASILEGLNEMLTVIRLGLPLSLRRSLACTNIIENMMGTVRRVCRNVNRWRDASMALRWTATAMQEAAKGFRRLKAHKQLPVLRAALAAHQAKHTVSPPLSQLPSLRRLATR